MSLPPLGEASFAGPSNSNLGSASLPCALCSLPSKYTCPRCALRTCSLPCSRTHKFRFSCSGTRDPTKFVDLKSYGQGMWADDYRWLEEGRRKVTEWGQGTEKDLAALEQGAAAWGGRGGRGGRGGGGDRGGRGRGGRGGGMAGRPQRGKTDALRSQLARRGCWVEFMPDGMARRKVNQSSWNPKSQSLYLTVHLSIPATLLDPSASPSDTPRLTTHPRVLFASPTESLPSLASLLPPSLTPEHVVLALPFYPSPARRMSDVQTTPAEPGSSRPKLYFPPLDPTKPLAAVLKGTAWVEFPILHVVPKTEWEEGMKGRKIVLVPLAEPRGRDDMRGEKRAGEEAQEGTMKKVKVVAEDQERALGALGDYDSEEYDDDDDDDGDGDGDHDDDDGHHDDDGEANDGRDNVTSKGLPEVDEVEGPIGRSGLSEGWRGDELHARQDDGALNEEARAAALFGAVDIPGGPDMLLRVGEALAKDFGEVPSE